MNNSEEYDEYLQILTGKNVGIIILCILGGILNSIMLYMLLHKKQIRTSVHTVYMVQIAVTDLLVCAIWLIMTSVITHNVFRIPNEGSGLIDQQVIVGPNTTISNVTSNRIDGESQFRSWTIMHSWYNFHYYVNIFLLASMSVERCAAVWKSMRCQRYQYNRKVIIVISIIMWLLALAFVLPEMINPNLVASESDSPDGISRILGPNEMTMGPSGNANPLSELGKRTNTNFSEKGLPVGKWLSSPSTTRPFENETRHYNADMDVLYACYTLLEKADREGWPCVESYGKLKVHVCFQEIFSIMNTYDPIMLPPEDENLVQEKSELFAWLPDTFSADASIYDAEREEFANIEYYVPEDDLYQSNDCESLGVDKTMYHYSLEKAIENLKEHFRRYHKMQSMCYPNLSKPSKIYILIINLVLGFFVPFSIIVFSYVSIACMIGKRVRNRMNTTLSETSTTHFQPNASSTDANQAGSIQLREKTQRNSRNDSMSRRMSDFMRYILLRKPHDGLENRSYVTDSDQHSTPFNSSRKTAHLSQAHRTEDSNYHGNASAAYQYSKPNTSEQQSSEDDPLHDPQFEEGMRQGGSVRLRNENSRIKYPVLHDTTNDNIPQTIEEHPYEAEGEEEQLLGASNGSSIIDGLAQQSVRATPAVRIVQRNSGSRRESGGSYGSSMDSMATDQTSLIPCIDKRYSGVTMTSALTPPTPIETSNPYTNQFFPAGDDRTAHQRLSSGDAVYVVGSGSNDSMKPHYRISTQRKHANENEQVEYARAKDTADGHRETKDGVFTKNRTASSRDGYSFPPVRGRNGQVRSNSRFNESQYDQESNKQNMSYNRQNSNTSGIFQPRRKLSSSSKRSTGGSHSSSRKRNIVHKYAEKQLRVSRTLLAYVIVFSLCWLPQRIAYLLFVIEALVGAIDLTCMKLITGVRILSFISVLLNPAVYILTQRQFQEYIRKSACVKAIRRWYTKCFKSKPRNQDIHMDSRYRITSERNDEIDQQVRGTQEDRHTAVTTRQNSNSKATYRMPTQARPVIHPRPIAGQHETHFAPPTMRHRDATIDEMKEEEAAAEESLEKEMKRRAAEEEKRRKDDINRNFMESSEEDILSNKTGSGSGNKTTSSSTKSDNFEELWKRWMQSGSAKIPSKSPNSDDNAMPGMESEFDNIETVPIRNRSVERGVLE